MLNFKAITRNRDKLGMSQSRLSELTGIPKESLSRLEHGKQMNPTLWTLESLAKALQIKVSDLITQDKQPVM